MIRQAEQGSAFQVPTIWHYEASQVACKLLKTGAVSQMDVFDYFNQLALLPIDTDIESHGNTFRTTLALGVQYNLSIYDAAYLELALRKGGVLATNDGQLIGVAKAAGIALLPR